jgi:hypothetical protein
MARAYAWLAEYMGPTATEEQAYSFGRFLAGQFFSVPELCPSRGTQEITDFDGNPISEDEWACLLGEWSKEHEEITA